MPLISSDIDGRPQERKRIGYFSITVAAFKALFQRDAYHHFSVTEGIPESAVFLGAEYSEPDRQWRVYFEHDDFSEVWESLPGMAAEHPITLHHVGDVYDDNEAAD